MQQSPGSQRCGRGKYSSRFSCIRCALCSMSLTGVIVIGVVLGVLLNVNNEYLQNLLSNNGPAKGPGPLDYGNLTTNYTRDCDLGIADLPTSVLWYDAPVFSCSSPNQKCLLRRLRCNGVNDCDPGSTNIGDDEAGCEEPCEKWVQAGLSFRCATMVSDSSHCLPAGLRCNGFSECNLLSVGDTSDEADCTDTQTVSVAGSADFKCKRGWNICGQKCYPDSYKCDKYEDCADGSDEMDCPVPASGR